MSYVFESRHKVTVWFFNLKKFSCTDLHFTAKTADYGTDLVKDFFTEHLAREIYIRCRKSMNKSLLLGVCKMN